VHEEWGDNIFVRFDENRNFDALDQNAPIKVTKTIRTARHCMFPMEGRGVLAYRDSRLRYLTLITSTQFPHSVQTGLCECLNLKHGDVRIISPDVGGGFGYKGLLCPEEVALGWLAMQIDYPVRWLEDCREHLTANANCREHHYEITGYAHKSPADARLLAQPSSCRMRRCRHQRGAHGDCQLGKGERMNEAPAPREGGCGTGASKEERGAMLLAFKRACTQRGSVTRP